METLLPILPHAVQMAQGIDLEHHQQEGDVAHP